MMGSQASRIVAHKMGIDYVGCEIDKYYFDKGCEFFDRECNGITTTEKGSRYEVLILPCVGIFAFFNILDFLE